jgi:DNA-binding transcriptional LysR family regulator
VVDETVGELILKPQIAAFLTAHQSLSIEFRQCAWTPEGTSADADLALQYVPASSAPVGVPVLNEQRLLTCASSQYLRERGLPHHPLDLRRHRHDGLFVSDNARSLSAWKFASGNERLNVEARVRSIVPSLSMALALTLGGAGVSQIPECWAIGHVRSGRLVRLLPDWEPSLHLFAFVPPGRCSPHASALLRFARNLIEMGAPTRSC